MQTLIDLTSDVATETVAVDVGLHEEEPPTQPLPVLVPGWLDDVLGPGPGQGGP